MPLNLLNSLLLATHTYINKNKEQWHFTVSLNNFKLHCIYTKVL